MAKPVMTRVLIVATLLGGAAAVLPSAPAGAVTFCARNYSCRTDFYKDAAHTQLQG